MLSFPNCKINLGLHVTEKRLDGFHTIETVMIPIPWTDVLEIVVEKKNTTETEFKSTGTRLFGPREKNLCMRAYHLLAEKYTLQPVKIYLHKIIPVGAGLGGGSSDAAHTLLMLDELFKLKLSDTQLENYASQLGSDCAFFIKNKIMHASGKGDILEPLKLKMKNIFCVIVKPRIHISTAQAYSWIKPFKRNNTLKELLDTPMAEWKNVISNDFEEAVFENHPSVKNIKNRLYKLGAVYASMSGSGSAVYGFFNEEKHLNTYFRSCTVWSGKIG